MNNSNITYYKFENKIESWILPVWKDSLMYKHPEECFQWDKDIHFVAEVTEEEYDLQFVPKPECIQLEFDFS